MEYVLCEMVTELVYTYIFRMAKICCREPVLGNDLHIYVLYIYILYHA
jgi:hypothetical protein